MTGTAHPQRTARQAAGAVTIRIDPGTIERAAQALGLVDADDKPGALAARILRHVAGEQTRTAVADGGGAPKRAGRAWEITVVDHANASGRMWDRAPLRGRRDLLDVTGCLPGGWLVGAKGVQNGVSAAKKLSEAADQSERALDNLPHHYNRDEVIPWQIIQRPNAPVGRAYAVTDYDYMLKICAMREIWEKAQERREDNAYRFLSQ